MVSKLHSTQNSALYLELSQIIIIISSGSIVLLAAWLVELISLEDHDKQQIGFFEIRFTVKYSDRLVATALLKVLDFQCLKVLGSVRLSLRLCNILVQFVTFMLFSGHLGICFTLPTAAVFAF